MPRARVVPPRGREESGMREFFWRGGIALRRTRKERQAPAHCPRPAGCGEARSSARSAHRNGHFPSSWKMSETPRAVRRDRAQCARRCSPRGANGPGRGRGFRFGAGVVRRCPPPHAVIRTLCPGGQSVRLRRTARRQRRARHSWQGKAGRAKQAGRAPGGDAVLHRPSGERKRSGRHRHAVRAPVMRRRLHFLTRSVQYHTVRYFFQERER